MVNMELWWTLKFLPGKTAMSSLPAWIRRLEYILRRRERFPWATRWRDVTETRVWFPGCFRWRICLIFPTDGLLISCWIPSACLPVWISDRYLRSTFPLRPELLVLMWRRPYLTAQTRKILWIRSTWPMITWIWAGKSLRQNTGKSFYRKCSNICQSTGITGKCGRECPFRGMVKWGCGTEGPESILTARLPSDTCIT